MSTTTYLQNTHTGTGSNTGAKATMSVWVKRTDEAGDDRSTIIGARTDDSNYFKIRFADNDCLMVYGAKSGSANVHIETDSQFRDVFGWYHVVLQIDTTHATESERVKWYVNGELQPIRSSGRVYPSQNDVNHLTSGSDINIGCNAVSSPNEHFDGTMSHFHMIDGTIYPPTAFGSTDSTTGEWKINTAPSVTYGAKGYFILKDGNSLTDASPNTNNFTLGAGTLTKTEDNPSNVFATLNSLDSDLTSNPFSNGNTKVTGQNPESVKYYCGLTLGMMGDGKYYFEAQLNVNNQGILGVCNLDASDNPTYLRQQNTFPGRYSSSWGYDLTDGYKFNNNNKTSYGSGTSWSANDFISFALDNTNGKMYIAKNGSWVSGGDPTNGTGGIDYSAIGDNNMFIVADNNNSGYNRFSFNFGNGAFDNTTLSTTYSPTVGATSAKFKYNIIPTGYTALSTKGLNQ